MTTNQKQDAQGHKHKPNMDQHADFKNFCNEGLRFGGVHFVANKSHGKTRLMFSVAETLRQQKSTRVLIFDGSETWLYAFNAIPVFTISELDIQQTQQRNTLEFEKYTLQNWSQVKVCLDTYKDLLFRLKTRKPSKRGFFVRTVVNYIDQQQREEKEQSLKHECEKSIAFFIEEAQNCFNSRSTASSELEEFLSVFNEARNQRIGFFTASQRLNDFSKTIRAKQLLAIGKLSPEDLTPQLRRIEKEQTLDFSNMKPRTWFYEGKTFVSPEFKQQGKPRQINHVVKAKFLASMPKPKTLREKLKDWLTARPQPRARERPIETATIEPATEAKIQRIFTCPNCGQGCSQEERQSGFCLDCDFVDFGL